MKKILVIAVLCIVGSLYAQNYGTELDSSRVSVQSLKRMLNGYTTELTDDQEAIIIQNSRGYKAILTVIDDAGIINLKAYWTASSDISDNRAYKIVNIYNRDKRYGKAYYSNDGDRDFVLQAIIPYDGGINRSNFLSNMAWFFTAVKSYAEILSEEQAIE